MSRLLTKAHSLSSLVRNAQAVPVCGYHSKVIDHYENPRNVGSLDKKQRNVGTGEDNGVD